MAPMAPDSPCALVALVDVNHQIHIYDEYSIRTVYSVRFFFFLHLSSFNLVVSQCLFGWRWVSRLIGWLVERAANSFKAKVATPFQSFSSLSKASDTLLEVTDTEPQDGSSPRDGEEMVKADIEHRAHDVNLYRRAHNGVVGMGQQRWPAIQFERINWFIFQE